MHVFFLALKMLDYGHRMYGGFFFASIGASSDSDCGLSAVCFAFLILSFIMRSKCQGSVLRCHHCHHSLKECFWPFSCWPCSPGQLWSFWSVLKKLEGRYGSEVLELKTSFSCQTSRTTACRNRVHMTCRRTARIACRSRVRMCDTRR